MGLDKLDHCSVRTTDIERTRDFYVDVLGLVDGARPDFHFPGYWLYLDEQPVIHIIGIDPDEAEGMKDPLGNALDDLSGSGSVDHIAFRASDLEGMHARLKKLGLKWHDRSLPDFGLHQVFVEDPNGITIELNYDAAEEAN